LREQRGLCVTSSFSMGLRVTTMGRSCSEKGSDEIVKIDHTGAL
jgi:hypothetical protein